MQPTQDGMMRLSMVSSIGDLLSASRISSCRWIDSKRSNNSRSPLEVCHSLLGMPGREDHNLWSEQAGGRFLCTSKLVSNPTASSDAATTSRTNPGIGADGKLTQEEWEHRHLKGLCYYCGITIDCCPDCNNSRHPTRTVGHATFTVTSDQRRPSRRLLRDPD